jgi:hypothetical protein
MCQFRQHFTILKADFSNQIVFECSLRFIIFWQKICTQMLLKSVGEIDSSGQFHQHFMQAFFVQKCFAKLFFHLHVTREKLPKRLLYKKGACKILMELTPGVDFINTLIEPLLHL